MSSADNDRRPHPVVLFIEDEPVRATVMEERVDEVGCDAVMTNGVAAAIGIVEKRKGMHVVFAGLDVTGSVMSLGLAAPLRDRWPPAGLVRTGVLAPHLKRVPARGIVRDKPLHHAKIIAASQRLAA